MSENFKPVVYDGKKYIVNPNTNRYILYDGKQYRKLVKEGIIKKPDKYQVTDYNNEEVKQEPTKPKYELIDMEEN